MPRISAHERENKIAYAKRLYIKGFDYMVIADMLKVTTNTIQKWAALNDFDQAKRAANISINEIRNEILNTYEDMKNGKTPKMSPDQISKLASSFDKLATSQKSITWTLEAYELLTESFLDNIQAAKTDKQKEKLYEHLKEVRKQCDNVIVKLQKELL